MNQKKTLGFALCASLLALPAWAQTVTLYGRADMSVSYQTRVFVGGKPVGSAVTALDSGGYSGSRLGVRGQEDLGGGLKALFVIEQGLQADTGVLGQSGRAWGRQAYVGLDASWGRLTLGRQYTPWFDALSNADPFGNNLVGNTGNLAFADARVDNAVLYRSPAMAGVTLQALVAAGEGTTGRQSNLSLQYQNGPLMLNAALGQFTGTPDARFALLGGSFDFGPAKLFAHYTQLSNLNPTVQAAPSTQAGAKGRSLLIGASAPLAGGTAMLSYTSLDDRRALDRDATQYALGYLYPVSKRTSLYGGFARVVNANGGTLTANTPSYPGRGEAQSQLGISHAF
jgi:predicted porin